MTTKRKISRNGRPRKARASTLPQMGGDHGTGTQAAMAGMQMVTLEGPNNMAQMVRVNVIDAMLRRKMLTMRQWQAAKAIQHAHGRLESLSSGSELKEWVQSSPKPDATVDAQCAAVSQYVYVTTAVPRAQRGLVEWICHDNRPSHLYARKRNEVRPLARFRVVMDMVADHMRM